ncbi:MAG: maleylacetoacetate isomerase, partial [Candidatus Puniceispirillaceae bacterium]
MADITLYDYWRSSASYRVRIALNLKGLAYDQVVVNLLAGEHRADAHRARSPIGYVPALEIDGQMMTQSMAILEYLEASYPDPALLPADPAEAARLRAIAYTIAMDIHPICNLNVTNHHAAAFDGDDSAKDAWMVHFMTRGLAAVEVMAGHPGTGPFLHGEAPGMADCVLVPQLYNARRRNMDLADMPR